MNKARRKEVARAIELIEQACEILETVKDEEQTAFENLAEWVQGSERGESMENCISALEDFVDNLDMSDLQEIADG